jgi:hypothetical protein
LCAWIRHQKPSKKIFYEFYTKKTGLAGLSAYSITAKKRKGLNSLETFARVGCEKKMWKNLPD